jgi:ParB family chromosome partitioning protein
VTGNKTVAGYVLAEEDPENKETNPVLKLQKQDRRNKEIAVEKLVDDMRKHLRETDIPQSDFMEFEDDLLYFAMLDDLNSEHFTLFLEKPQNKFHLTDEDKITIINSLTNEQKTLIRRDFLIKHPALPKKSYLMLTFARLHFPQKVTETETGYNDIYAKRHERITKKLEALKQQRA